MNTYFVKTPKWLMRLYPKRLWHKSRKDSSIYLTFDDGPIPDVTPWVLDQLKAYNAKATFFCIGENIRKYPEIFKQIIAEGHSIGNHTQHHLKGWKTDVEPYLEDVEDCQKGIDDLGVTRSELKIHRAETSSLFKALEAKDSKHKAQSTQLFRPPYGKLTSKQAKILQKKGFKIVMWDVLSADYDQSISKEKCLQNVLQYTQNGSIVIFHDSLKAKDNLQYVLPKVLERFSI